MSTEHDDTTARELVKDLRAERARWAGFDINVPHIPVLAGRAADTIEALLSRLEQAEKDAKTFADESEDWWKSKWEDAVAITDEKVDRAAIALSEYGLPDVPLSLWLIMARDALIAASQVSPVIPDTKEEDRG